MPIDEKKVKDLVTKWRDVLRLYNWDTRYRIVDKLAITSDYGNVFMEPDILRFTVQVLRTCLDKDLENFIVHEMVHILINPLMAYCDDFIGEFFGNRERIILRKQLFISHKETVSPSSNGRRLRGRWRRRDISYL